MGAVLVSNTENNGLDNYSSKLLATGYSRELEGNTHAEECCLLKIGNLGLISSTLYTTMEPCGKRLSGKDCCAMLIIKSGIKRVVYIVKEPSTFVGNSVGIELLEKAGIQVVQLPEFTRECCELNSHLTGNHIA